MTEFVNLIIDRTILFDIGIARRYISFWLVVIIVRHEVFDRIFWKEFLELTIKLTSQGLVVGDDQGWLIDTGDNLAHGIGLTSTSRPHENLGFSPPRCYQPRFQWLGAGHQTVHILTQV